MAKKNVKFMLTAFRDGFQSVVGARVLSKDFLPCVEEAYAAGVRWFEAGGGARFQSCYFYCQEDAFDVMDKFRKAAPEADLQTLSRGVNVVGLESQSSDMIKLHAQMFKKHGMSSIRNVDALNDVNNLKWSGQCIHDAGLNHEVVVTMMGLPPGIDNKGTHTPEFYRDTLKKIMDAGIPFDRVAFKDASGTSTPATVYNTMKLARQLLGDKIHIQFHSHETAGNGVACYLAALKGGADGLDLSMAPMSGGTCQPDIITMWHCLDGDPDFGFDFDINKIKKAEDSFKNAMKKYFLPPEAMNVNPQIVWSPMPGGALRLYTEAFEKNASAAAGALSSPELLPYYAQAGNTTDILLGMNARELLHFLRLRTCARAQWEIRGAANEMLALLMEDFPELFKYYGPGCAVLGYCPEGRLSCGKPVKGAND